MTATHTTNGAGGRSARRTPPKLWQVPVLRTEQVTPRLIRVTVGGPALADFPGAGGDQHVVLYFYDKGADLPDPLTLDTARTLLSQIRPAMRSYTVRRFDHSRHELDLDFVLHGEPGPGSALAQSAQPGDPLIVVGPSPAYRLDPEVPHLLVGDETALPAISTMLAELPASADTRVVVEVADRAEEQRLTGPAKVTWVHRDAGADLMSTVRELAVPTDVWVWAAGERSVMRELRNHLIAERGLDRRRVRPTSYWRRGHGGSPD
jgi:NADPH-dependent ferric siderophore reductase